MKLSFVILACAWGLPWLACGQVLLVDPPVSVEFHGEEGGSFEAWYAGPVPAVAVTATTTAPSAEVTVATPAGSLLLVRQTREVGGMIEESLLVAGRTKYGALRIENRWEAGGAGRLIASRAMAAGHLLVRLREDVTPEAARQRLQAMGDVRLIPLRQPGLYRLELPAAGLVTVPTAMTWLAALPDVVAYAEPDLLVSAEELPNDPRFGELWGLHNTGQAGGTSGIDIGAIAAWTLSTGSDDILIGIVDTGVDYTHPDLAAAIWTNPGEIPNNGIDDDQNGFVDDVRGWNFVRDTNDPMDDHKHGTHVAGTIGAIANNGIGVTGVAPQVRIVPLKFLDDRGYGFVSDAVEAIHYARIVGCLATNNSWAGGGTSQSLVEAVQAADAAGGLLVAAAGNDGRSIDLFPVYPGALELPNAITVAALDRQGLLASYSNYGERRVHLGAPGSSVLSTFPNDSYGYLSGTSMATPHVTGILALMRAYFPEYSHRRLRNRLLGTAVPTASLAGKTVTGGRANAWEALSDPGPDLLTLSNSSGSAVHWTLTTNVPWLSATGTGGTIGAAGSATLRLEPTEQARALTAGSYQGVVQIAYNGASQGGVLSRQVTLTVIPSSEGRLVVSPATPLDASGPEGGPIDPVNVVYTLHNPGLTDIQVTIANTQPWLRLNATELAVNAGKSVAVTAQFDANALRIGTYADTLVFTNTTNDRGSLSLPVTLQITQPGVMTVSPASGLVASGLIGGPFAPSQLTFTVRNHGESPIDWQIDDDVDWLFYSSSGGRLSHLQTAEVTVRINDLAGLLIRGTHLATITFTNRTNGLGNTQRLVALTVLKPPTLTVSPSIAAAYAGLPGGPWSPAAMSYVLRNTGDVTLTWAGALDVDWVDLSTAQGQLAPDEQTTIALTPNGTATTLDPAVYRGRLTLACLDGGIGTTSRDVSLTVLRPATLDITPLTGFLSRGEVGLTPQPDRKTWYCRNTGEESLDLEVMVSEAWLDIDGAGQNRRFTVAPGEVVPVLVSVVGEALSAGDHAALVSFTNHTNGLGTTTRQVALSLTAEALHAVYLLSLRGRWHAGGSEAVSRAGYLVVDRRSQLVSVVFAWRQAGNLVYDAVTWNRDVQLQYALDAGGRQYEFLSLLSSTQLPDRLQRLDLQQVYGEARGPVDLGGGKLDTLPLQYRGTTAIADEVAGTLLQADLTARILVPQTRQANATQQGHAALVESLAASLAAAGYQPAGTQALPATAPASVAATGPVTVYNLRLSATDYRDGQVVRADSPGFAVLDRSGRQVVAITVWQSATGRVYDIESWSGNQLLWYSLSLGGRDAEVLSVLYQSGLPTTSLMQLFTLAGIVQSAFPVGGGSSESLAPTLAGNRWLHDAAGAGYGAGSLRLTLDRVRTASANGRNLSLSATVNELTHWLDLNGWRRAVDDQPGFPGQ